MRFFSGRFYRNLVFVYTVVLFGFASRTLMTSIPDHIYVREDSEPDFKFSVPVRLVQMEETEESEEQETFLGLLPRKDDSFMYGHEEASSNGQAGKDYVLSCRLLGLIPVKNIAVTVVSDTSVYASGRVIGIYGQTAGVLVLRTTEVKSQSKEMVNPAENKVFAGDYIYAANGQAVSNKEELVEIVQKNGRKPMVLSLYRKGESIDVSITPVAAEKNTCLLGIWIKDDMAGIGTMTYYTKEGRFGALGHGIGDGETGELLEMAQGRIYGMRLMGIKRGEKGEPGELEGVIYYGSSSYLGTVDENGKLGIHGTLTEKQVKEYMSKDCCYEVGYKQEIEKSAAYILSDISGSVEIYEIMIDSIDYQATDNNKGIRFHVTDSRLIEMTGGIVQGMSGSPIIQNGKIIGAVTHVLVNDPEKGYGIFIENMLEGEK